MDPMSRVLPTRERKPDIVTTSLRITTTLLKKLETVAAETGYSRSDVMVQFMEWALREHEAESAKPKK